MRIILIGYGVVGQSFTKLLISKLVDLYNLYGMKPRIVACVDNKGSAIDTSGLDIQRLLEIKKNKGTVGEYYNNNKSKLEPIQIIENIDAEIVMELTPTNLKDGEPGLSHIISAMKYGKNVITVNKGPLSVAFSSLIELANFNGISFKFSGTVGGGTPILEFAKRCLKGDRIISFKGILNGTTNYILSKMEEGLTFNDALNDAQNKGYAEAVPSLDIDGYDAAAKLVIMANWLMGMKVALEDVNRNGISTVKTQEVSEALKKGNAVKLVATCENKKLVVKPIEVSKLDPLCVNGTLNSVTFSLEYAGNQTIIGRGAGGIETASAVLRDMIEIRDNIINGKNMS
ncbi:MAG TPA: homoserine dehydrogenase [Nitrososphaeraceae archaeon]|nr:homoserine dehydrogenase [Nitrososphaeraceae archaeon]HEU5172021.1 homoserine dehydrogenase [Nitrososphaeraceae archaeon]